MYILQMIKTYIGLLGVSPLLALASVSIPNIGTVDFHTITLFSAYRTDNIYQYPFDIKETGSARPIEITATSDPSCSSPNHQYGQCLVNEYNPDSKIYYSAEYFSCASSLGDIKDVHLTESGISSVSTNLSANQANCSTINGQLDFSRFAKIAGSGGLAPIMAGPYHGSLHLNISEA